MGLDAAWQGNHVVAGKYRGCTVQADRAGDSVLAVVSGNFVAKSLWRIAEEYTPVDLPVCGVPCAAPCHTADCQSGWNVFLRSPGMDTARQRD